MITVLVMTCKSGERLTNGSNMGKLLDPLGT